MEQSPLTQQARPETFEPKVAQLYRQLFKDDEDDEKPEGFWKELFLLKPDTTRLGQTIDHLHAIDLVHHEHQSQQLLLHSIRYIKDGLSPADENAVDTLTVFLASVFSKRYTNPSSDIIEVLAGLDNVDAVFTDLVATLEHAIKSGRSIHVRSKAVQVALCVASGAFQTSLLTYFTQRDLFPALMKLIHDAEDPGVAVQPFLTAGLLANYNKFETRNPYHVRFADFVNEETIQKISRCVDQTCKDLRDQYVEIQNDVPEAWSLGGTLSYVGLGALTGSKPAAPVLSEDDTKVTFGKQPMTRAAMLLSMYDFILANKMFSLEIVQSRTETKKERCTLASFLSFTSYLQQHAHRSDRAATYAHLSLLIIQLLVEDAAIAKRLCETNASVRLCRQRPPSLPAGKANRSLASGFVDIMVDSINHNLRRRLDVELYLLNIGILLRLLSFLSRARIRLPYHWSELWRALLSFIRFLTIYVDDVKTIYRYEELIQQISNLLAFSLTHGESFLPDTASYDDLFYKLVEFGNSLYRFRDAYALQFSSAAGSIGILISVSKHYTDLIEGERAKVKNLSPREVSKIIKQGYETLSIENKEGLDHYEKFREADHKSMLKRLTRVVVADAKELASSSAT